MKYINEFALRLARKNTTIQFKRRNHELVAGVVLIIIGIIIFYDHTLPEKFKYLYLSFALAYYAGVLL